MRKPFSIRSLNRAAYGAADSSHRDIPDPGAQMVRYYGWYSNASRGKRRLAGQAAAAKAPSDEPETEADGFSRARRQNWARLLRKIYVKIEDRNLLFELRLASTEMSVSPRRKAALNPTAL